MTEHFEEQLSQRLHAHPLPESREDLHLTSMALGERIRRRRIGAAVGVLVLLLAVPGIAAAWMRVSNTDRPPVTTMTPARPSGPESLTLDPLNRLSGAPPEIAIVRDRTVWLSDGGRVELPRNQVGTVAEFGSTAAWLTRSGSALTLNLSPTLAIAGDATEVTGVEPGPGGSVMVRTKTGPLLWTRDSGLVRPAQAELRTTAMAASADALWVTGAGSVTRVDLSDPTRSVLPSRRIPEWTSVVSADVRADRVVVRDVRNCHAVLDGATAAVMWRTCDHRILALSPDGRFAAAQSLIYRTTDILAIPSGELRLRIDTGATRTDIDTNQSSVGTQLVFDERGRLNLLVGEDGWGPFIVTVEASGECWQATEPDLAATFVLPGRR